MIAMPFLVKICGLSTIETLDAALDAGADMIGLVRFPRSPRHVGLDQGRALSERALGRAQRVALLVDPTDEDLAATMAALSPDLVQLHGHETPERVAAIRARTGLPVMKAIGIGDDKDLAGIPAHAAVADRLLLDAKPPRDAGALPGGNGLSFDWRLIAALDPGRPIMLSGGLNPQNVGEAIGLTGMRGVDVSSGVESAPGVKDPDRIAAFVKAARAAFERPRKAISA
jgi:phosphoribosylanthranilate isomerase